MVRNLEKKKSYYKLILPGFIIYIAIILFPVLVSFFLSFTKWRHFKMQSFVGLQNYVNIFKDPSFQHAIWNNIQITLISVLGQIPLGILSAYILYRKWVKGNKFFEMMIFLPAIISNVVVALLWNRIFSPVGIYTDFVRRITGNPDFVVKIFENRNWAMIPILAVLLWQCTSLYMVIFLANM